MAVWQLCNAMLQKFVLCRVYSADICSVCAVLLLAFSLLHDITEGKLLGTATRGRKRMELLHDVMEGRYCG